MNDLKSDFIANLNKIHVQTFWDLKSVSIDGDIIIGGGSKAGADNYSKSLHKLSCANGVCNWTKLPQAIENPRGHHIAMVVPDDFFDCL